MFQVHQKNFEGPLAILFDLITQEKLSISEISLAQVADDYIAYVKSREADVSPHMLAEFLVIAAQLILLKSRALLPNMRISEEEEESIGELEARVARYEKVRILAKALAELEGKKMRIATRTVRHATPSGFYPPLGLGLAVFSSVYAEFLSSLPAPLILEEATMLHTFSLQEKINRIEEALAQAYEQAFSDLTRGARNRVEIIVSFLALLELMKQRALDLYQEKPFEEIRVRKIAHMQSAQINSNSLQP